MWKCLGIRDKFPYSKRSGKNNKMSGKSLNCFVVFLKVRGHCTGIKIS